MVLSLVGLSLRAITKGIKNGTIRHAHLLPSILRERVLDMAVKEDLANHPNILEILASVEFLNGISSISFDACNYYDMKFLERLVESLATELPNGETIGAHITKLNLILHEPVPWSSRKDFSAASDLISQCPNTKSLDLRIMKNDESVRPGHWPLAENSAWIRVMENLIELSLYNWTQANNGRLMINFNRLTTLKLDRCSLADNQWFEILTNIPLVENLHLIDFRCTENWQQKKLDWILPFSLPHLKKLEIIGDAQIFECNKKFVNNLIGCPKLRQVHLMLDKKSTDEECLIRLAKMEIDLKMKISLSVNGGNTAENASIFDSSSRFQLVRIFHEKMDLFELIVFEWDSRVLKVLEDVVGSCSNLTKFGIGLPPIESKEDMKRVNAAMVQFFGNLENAMKLKYFAFERKFRRCRYFNCIRKLSESD